MILRKVFTWGVLLTIPIGLIGCESWLNSHQNPFSISEIADKENGKKVYIAGEVIRTIPLVNNGAYQLQDETGKVWILTTAKLPSIKDQISIQGKIQYQELSFSEEELYLQELDTQPYQSEL